MPLRMSRHDPAVERVAIERLEELLGQPEQSAPLFGDGIDPSRSTLAAPHLGYVADLDRLRAGEVVSAARRYAMRFLILVGPGRVGSMDVDEEGPGEPPVVSRVGSGPYDAALLDALREAREALAEAEPEIEPRLLLAPSLQLAALWLHGPEDSIVPLPPTPAGLTAGKAYSESEATPILRRLADEIRPAEEP